MSIDIFLLRTNKEAIMELESYTLTTTQLDKLFH